MTTEDMSPPTCELCYRAWLGGSVSGADDCVSGCHEAYDAWYFGGGDTA